MKVKEHTYVRAQELVDDPAQYAHDAHLIGRHEEWVFRKIGAWRWPVMHTHRERIKELVSTGYVIDLGGAAAPVGYGASIVDYQGPHGAPRSLLDVPPDADCVFCSHTLEHFVDMHLAVASVYHKLKDGGHFIVQVPGWQRPNLRAENWDYHEQTFCLSWETNAPAAYTRLDTLLAAHGFELEVCEYGEFGREQLPAQNILAIARKV